MTEEKLKNSIEIRSKIKLLDETIDCLKREMIEEKIKLGMIFVDDSEAEKIEKGIYRIINISMHNCSNGPEKFRIVNSESYETVREFWA